MTREEDEERSAARAAERMLDRREGGSPYRSEVDDVRRDLRGLVQQLNERLNDGTRVARRAAPRPRSSFRWRPIPTARTCRACANGW